MGEVFQGINSRVSKTSIQSELIGSSLCIITRNSKNVINIEISEPPLAPYDSLFIETTLIALNSDINEGELINKTNTTKANINIEIFERELAKGVCYAEITQFINQIEVETPLSNITRNSKTAINLEISAPPYPPYNDSVIETTKNVLAIELYQRPLFNDKTYTVYLGDTEIPDIYVGDNLLTDISFIITKHN